MKPFILLSSFIVLSLAAILVPALSHHQWLTILDNTILDNVISNKAANVQQMMAAASFNSTIPTSLYYLTAKIFGISPQAFHYVNAIIYIALIVLTGYMFYFFIPSILYAGLGMFLVAFCPFHIPMIGAISLLPEVLVNFFLMAFIIIFWKGLKGQFNINNEVASRRKKLTFFMRLFLLLAFLILALMSQPFLVWKDNALYFLNCVGIGLLLVIIKRFDEFLKTQEMIIRVLYWVGLALLLCVMLLYGLERLNRWSNDVRYWSMEAKENKRPLAYVEWARAVNNSKESTLNPIKILDEGISIWPKEPSLYMEKAVLKQEEHDWVEAKRVYELLLKQVPFYPDAILGLAYLSFMEGQLTQMIDQINSAIKAHPDDEYVYLKAMLLYTKAVEVFKDNTLIKEKREELLDDMQELSKRKKYTAADFYNLALLYQQVGGKDEAMRYYQRALELSPTHRQSLISLAYLYQVNGDNKAAQGLYNRLIHEHPKYADGYVNYGLMLSALGDVAKAKSMFMRAIDIEPKHSMALFNLGYILETEGDLKGAAEFYEKAIEYNDRNAEAYYNLGNVYAKQNLIPEAIAAYLKTVNIQPRHINAFVNLSIISFKAKDPRGAILYLNKAKVLGYVPPEDYVKTLAPYLTNK